MPAFANNPELVRGVTKNTLVIRNLAKIMKSNTRCYRSDFKIDVKWILKFAKTKQDFCWMSRNCGTQLYISKCLKNGENARCISFNYYRHSISEHPVVYEITNLRYDRYNRVIGDIYALDYDKCCEMLGI